MKVQEKKQQRIYDWLKAETKPKKFLRLQLRRNGIKCLKNSL